MQENVNGSYKGQMERRAKWRPEGATSNDFTKVLDGKNRKGDAISCLDGEAPPPPLSLSFLLRLRGTYIYT